MWSVKDLATYFQSFKSSQMDKYGNRSCYNTNGGVAQMVERSLSMREVPGSIPGASNYLFSLFAFESNQIYKKTEVINQKLSLLFLVCP